VSRLSRVQLKIARLLVDRAGILCFPEGAVAKVAAVVEVAARLPDRTRGDGALYDLMALMVALARQGHQVAADQLSMVFRTSPAALTRLAELKERMEPRETPLMKFSDLKAVKRAPQQGAAPPPATIQLKQLLTPSRRLERPSRTR
jgi:hypothetical protein